jgi:hypothetical protein
MTQQASAPALPRIFVIGSNRIAEDESNAHLTNQQVQNQLKGLYPEIANATIRERVEANHRVIEFLPVPGRKG